MLPASLLALLSIALAAPIATPAGVEARPAQVERALGTASRWLPSPSVRTKATANPTPVLPKTSVMMTTPLPTATTGSGLSGPGYWNLKSRFYSLASFQQSFAWRAFTFGAANVQVVQGVPRSAWSSGVVEANNQSALQVAFPKGSYSPGHDPVGGVGFYSSPLDLTQANNVSFSYSIFFPADFDFVRGGKLPGLYAGRSGCSGGQDAEDCFSTRLMWRTNGQGELYLYAPRSKQVASLCTLPPLSFCNSVDGMSIGRGSWTFNRGQWNNMRQDIWLNTPGKADGGFNIWFNGKLVLHSDTVYYRNPPTSKAAIGASNSSQPLIDYDSLPDGTIIPNGGFNSTSQIPGYTTAKISVNGSLPTDPSTGLPSDWENRRKQRRRSTVNLEGRQTIKTASLPIGFIGTMTHLFFGGSTVAWASPKLQYAYLNQAALRIRS